MIAINTYLLQHLYLQHPSVNIIQKSFETYADSPQICKSLHKYQRNIDISVIFLPKVAIYLDFDNCIKFLQ